MTAAGDVVTVGELSEKKKLSAEDFPIEVLTSLVMTILLGEILSSLLFGDARTISMVFLARTGGEISLTFLTGVAGETSLTFLTGVAGEVSRTLRTGDVSICSGTSSAEEEETCRTTRWKSSLSYCEEASECVDGALDTAENGDSDLEKSLPSTSDTFWRIDWSSIFS